MLLPLLLGLPFKFALSDSSSECPPWPPASSIEAAAASLEAAPGKVRRRMIARLKVLVCVLRTVKVVWWCECDCCLAGVEKAAARTRKESYASGAGGHDVDA